MRNVIVSLALAALLPASAYGVDKTSADVEAAATSHSEDQTRQTSGARCADTVEYYTINSVVQGRLQPVRMERKTTSCN